jgi:hypothetical protein
MNQADFLAYAVTVEESSLSSLYYWLQYEKHTWILGSGIGWLSHSIVSMILAIATIIFTPYMLWHLFQAKWYKAIITYCSIVILPFLIHQIVQIDNSVISFLLGVLPLVTFYFYAYVISYLIGEHLNKLQTIRRWEKKNSANSNF